MPSISFIASTPSHPISSRFSYTISLSSPTLTLCTNCALCHHHPINLMHSIFNWWRSAILSAICSVRSPLTSSMFANLIRFALYNCSITAGSTIQAMNILCEYEVIYIICMIPFIFYFISWQGRVDIVHTDLSVHMAIK